MEKFYSTVSIHMMKILTAIFIFCCIFLWAFWFYRDAPELKPGYGLAFSMGCNIAYGFIASYFFYIINIFMPQKANDILAAKTIASDLLILKSILPFSKLPQFGSGSLEEGINIALSSTDRLVNDHAIAETIRTVLTLDRLNNDNKLSVEDIDKLVEKLPNNASSNPKLGQMIYQHYFTQK